MPPRSRRKFPLVDELTLHFANMHYYKGAIAALEHVLKTGLDRSNVEKTLDVYRCLLQNEDPKAAQP